MRNKLFITLVLVLIFGLLAACGAAPQIEDIPTDAALKVTGMVENEVGWAEDTLKAMNTIQAEATNKKGEISTYTGVPLSALLDQAVVKADASTLVFVAADGSEGEVSLADAKACSDCLVSFRNQGGFSMVMPNFDGKAQVKGVIEIKVK